MNQVVNDPLKYAVDAVGGDPFATLLGIKVEEAREAYARVSLTIKPEHCNAEDRTHGAVLFSLADQALAVAANTRGYKAFAIEVKINYLQGSSLGEVLAAEATPVDIRKRISLWNIEITNQQGERIAMAQGLAYHFV